MHYLGQVGENAPARKIAAMRPSACHIGLYLGLKGDIRAHGASASNHWFYETTEFGDSLCDTPEGALR